MTLMGSLLGGGIFSGVSGVRIGRRGCLAITASAEEVIKYGFVVPGVGDMERDRTGCECGL